MSYAIASSRFSEKSKHVVKTDHGMPDLTSLSPAARKSAVETWKRTMRSSGNKSYDEAGKVAGVSSEHNLPDLASLPDAASRRKALKDYKSGLQRTPARPTQVVA